METIESQQKLCVQLGIACAFCQPKMAIRSREETIIEVGVVAPLSRCRKIRPGRRCTTEDARPGPVFTYSVGNMVFLHASDPAVVRDVCLSVSPDELGKSSYMKVTHHPLFGDGILKSNGDAWARQRKLIAPEFFPDKGMVDLMVDSARALVCSWEARVARTDGGAMELTVDDDFRTYSGDVISRTCFGSSYVKGKRIFAMIRELQKTVSRPNLLAEMTGLRFLPTRSNREAWRLNRRVRRLILDVGFAMAELKVLLSFLLFRFEAALSSDYLHSPVLRLTVEPEHGVRLVLRSVRPNGES
uniref:Secologanin synthase n=1 Tax=Aegilops tauschii TaxID=37682 RepID=M8BQH9_AEGTA